MRFYVTIFAFLIGTSSALATSNNSLVQSGVSAAQGQGESTIQYSFDSDLNLVSTENGVSTTIGVGATTGGILGTLADGTLVYRYREISHPIPSKVIVLQGHWELSNTNSVQSGQILLDYVLNDGRRLKIPYTFRFFDQGKYFSYDVAHVKLGAAFTRRGMGGALIVPGQFTKNSLVARAVCNYSDIAGTYSINEQTVLNVTLRQTEVCAYGQTVHGYAVQYDINSAQQQ